MLELQQGYPGKNAFSQIDPPAVRPKRYVPMTPIEDSSAPKMLPDPHPPPRFLSRIHFRNYELLPLR